MSMISVAERAESAAPSSEDVGGAATPAAHVPALDGLRGVAVLLVVACHANLAFGGAFATGPVAGPLASLLTAGWVGVDLFFVLSGYLITGILFQTRADPHYLRNFYARRALRIFPLYYLFVLGMLAAQRVSPGFLGIPAPQPGQAWSLIGYYYNFYAAFSADGVARGFHFFWSLAVEEHFYLVWPFVVLRLSRGAIMRLCLVGMAAAFVLRIVMVETTAWLQTAYLLTPCRIDGLLAGAFVALGLGDPVWRRRLREWSGPAALLGACIVAALMLRQRHFSDSVDFRFEQFRLENGPAHDSTLVLTIGLSAVAVLFAAILVRVLEAPAASRLRRACEARWLMSFGQLSYGIYIFHALLLRAILFYVYVDQSWIADLPDLATKPALFAATAGASWLVAHFSYGVFESRFLQLKQRFRPATVTAR